MFRRISHGLNLFTYSLRAVGPGTMVRNALRWAGDPEARDVGGDFDDRYGTDTCSELTPREAAIPGARRGEATMYLPTTEQDLVTMLDALPWSGRLKEASTFVDLGSGKGRAVLVAAMKRFREVVGVELSPVLQQVATRNVGIVHAAGELASPVKLVLEDAATYDMPAGPLVVYMYHPFKGSVAQQVMARLRAAIEVSARAVAILYCHPTLQAPLDRSLFEEGGLFQLGAHGERRTRRFRVGWSVFSNDAWLQERRSCSSIS